MGRFYFGLILWLALVPAFSANDSTMNFPPKKGAPYIKGKYQNPYVKEAKKSFFKFAKMKYFGDEEWADYEAEKDSVPRYRVDLKFIKSSDTLPRLTWVGHSTFLIQIKGLNILTDPIFSERASPLSFAGPKRIHAPALSIEELPPIDFVIISHNHYDHLDKKTVEQLGNSTRWYVPLGHKKWFSKRGIHKDSLIEFDWWDSHTENGYVVTATPSQHWSARSLTDRLESLWSSWVIQVGDFTLWFGGDTGYNPYQFKQIGREFPAFDLALIPIGAYAPRSFMKNMHVNPEEAVKIHQDIESCQSLGMHWGTFPLTAEPVWEPPVLLKKALKEVAIPEANFQTLALGQTWRHSSNSRQEGCGSDVLNTSLETDSLQIENKTKGESTLPQD